MKKVAVALAEGFEEIEAVSIIDVLRRAELDVVAISITGNLEVTGSHNIKIMADQLFEEVNYKTIEMIVLPGGMPGSANLNSHIGLNKQILNFNKKGKALGAICAAPLVFGNLGILENKNAICYPGFEKYLKGAKILDADIIQSDNIITGKGAGVAIKFALKLLKN